jgi:quinol monooxygenase YgiN
MIIVRATTFIADQSRDKFVELTQKTIQESLAEDGCISYTCSADLSDPAAFHWLEVWRDEKSFAAHWHADHHTGFLAALADQAVVQRAGTPTASFFSADEIPLQEALHP